MSEIPWIFQFFLWFSLSIPVCSKFPDFSLTGKRLPIFQVFQSEWEPWLGQMLTQMLMSILLHVQDTAVIFFNGTWNSSKRASQTLIFCVASSRSLLRDADSFCTWSIASSSASTCTKKPIQINWDAQKSFKFTLTIEGVKPEESVAD